MCLEDLSVLTSQYRSIVIVAVVLSVGSFSCCSSDNTTIRINRYRLLPKQAMLEHHDRSNRIGWQSSPGRSDSIESTSFMHHRIYDYLDRTRSKLEFHVRLCRCFLVCFSGHVDFVLTDRRIFHSFFIYFNAKAYNIWTATYAHSIGLAVALKNTVGLIPELVDHVDFAINEECQTYNECDTYQVRPYFALHIYSILNSPHLSYELLMQ
jgi:hypothetical protein